jgi:hypothetical protein
MKWISYGNIFEPKKYLKWVKSHAWVPTPIIIKKNITRVFFAARDSENHSNICYFDVSLDNPNKILKFSKTPVLKKGRRGCFDDCAAIPSQVIKIKNKYHMYYVGWTRGVSVPYISSIGLAISNKLNGKFRRYSEAPIIGKNPHDPIFTASCFVQYVKKKFKMIYTSNKSWKNKPFFIPNYNLKLAYSKNGIDWKTTSELLLKKNNNEIAITRPWIVTSDKQNFIIYSYKDYRNKGRNYKIGIAKKTKNSFIRKDNSIKIINKKDFFDNQMQEYASIVEYKNFFYMFYNGNNYGEKGIGLAVISKKSFLQNFDEKN